MMMSSKVGQLQDSIHSAAHKWHRSRASNEISEAEFLISGMLLRLLSATALRIPFLDPYGKGVGSNFRRGVNFASSGARATNGTASSPFSLSIQLYQFREFKREVLDLLQQG